MHSGEKVCLAIVGCHGLHYFLEHYQTCFHLEYYSSKEFSLGNFLQGRLLLKPFRHGFLLIIISPTVLYPHLLLLVLRFFIERILPSLCLPGHFILSWIFLSTLRTISQQNYFGHSQIIVLMEYPGIPLKSGCPI